jgi:hypothetical protein
MEQLSTEKLQLASECYEQVDRYIIELDKAYGKFAKNIGGGGQGKLVLCSLSIYNCMQNCQFSADKKSSKTSSANRKKKSRVREVETDATVDSMGK